MKPCVLSYAILFFFVLSCGSKDIPGGNGEVYYDDYYCGIQLVEKDKWEETWNDEYMPLSEQWDCSYEIHFMINKGNPGCSFFAGFRSIVKKTGNPAADTYNLSCIWDGEDFDLFDDKGTLRFRVRYLGTDKYTISWPISPGPFFDRFAEKMGWESEMTLDKSKIALCTTL